MMSSTFTWCTVCGSGGIVVGVCGLLLRVARCFLCRVLCIFVRSLSRLGMISLEMVSSGSVERTVPY